MTNGEIVTGSRFNKLHGDATSASFELDYQTTDAGNPPVAIVYQNDISIAKTVNNLT